MIIDIHTHFFDADKHLDPRVKDDLTRGGMDAAALRFDFDDYLRGIDGADRAVVFGLSAGATGWHIPNDAVAAHAKQWPVRLIFFASPDPGKPGFMDELERCHRDLGCRGVKLGPIYQGVHPLDERNMEIYAYCQRNGLPVMMHMATTFSGGTPLEYARPVHIDTVACRFPDLRIVLAHMGHPWEGEAIAAIRRNRNLYADISALYPRPWQFYNALRLAVEYRTDHKLLFGSDFPFTTTAGSIGGMRSVNDILGTGGLPAIPSEVIEGIIHRDSLTLLGIDDPV